MALTKGARLCYEWLRTQVAGTIVSRSVVAAAAGWKPISLRTYLNKNKLAPFLLPLENDELKVLMDGAQISEKYFDEVFTQTAPPKITLSVGDTLSGNAGRYSLVEPLGNGAVGHVWSAKVLDEDYRLVLRP